MRVSHSLRVRLSCYIRRTLKHDSLTANIGTVLEMEILVLGWYVDNLVCGGGTDSTLFFFWAGNARNRFGRSKKKSRRDGCCRCQELRFKVEVLRGCSVTNQIRWVNSGSQVRESGVVLELNREARERGGGGGLGV